MKRYVHSTTDLTALQW